MNSCGFAEAVAKSCGVLVPTANKKILQVLTFLHKVVPAVPAKVGALILLRFLVVLKSKGFVTAAHRDALCHRSLPRDQLPPAHTVLHQAGACVADIGGPSPGDPGLWCPASGLC